MSGRLPVEPLYCLLKLAHSLSASSLDLDGALLGRRIHRNPMSVHAQLLGVQSACEALVDTRFLPSRSFYAHESKRM